MPATVGRLQEGRGVWGGDSAGEEEEEEGSGDPAPGPPHDGSSVFLLCLAHEEADAASGAGQPGAGVEGLDSWSPALMLLKGHPGVDGQ